MHRHRIHALRRELVVLILHQRDEWTDDDRKPRKNPRRQLVDNRLPAAGGHHDERITSLENRFCRLPLAGSEIGMTEALFEQRLGRFLCDFLRHGLKLGTNYSVRALRSATSRPSP